MDNTSSMGAVGPVFWIVCLAVAVFYIWCMWRIFEKAGKPGWAVIIPIYNMVVLLQIVGRPIWWIILMIIPLVGLIVSLIVTNDLSKVFGHGIGFTLGLIFLGFIFYPILAFDSSSYTRPAAA